ncbi:hypothetical protein [Microbacterium telephonicum]|uniref:Uncharacterized protein n=1 Tax=Microbacterium telephonicum TaxID=1714841 RepID=A0A498BXH1_9MICO|nr:hypothetical protein [Microbacterium telephonicum]RLK47649.1 hypothetical protein C7474_2244 [Microbacterium telephonicum]
MVAAVISRLFVFAGVSLLILTSLTNPTIDGADVAAASIIGAGWLINALHGRGPLIADRATSDRYTRVDTELRTLEGKQP